MNEHDSERIAGLLEADGLVAADSVDDADVVVLNTCCIRENADNRLYGTLGHLKSTKDAQPGMQIAVAGCLAQKDRDLIQQKAPFVDAVFGTHNVGRAAELLREARPSTGRSPRSSKSPRRSRRRCRCGATCRTRRGSRSRSAATTRARSASCRRCGARRSAGRWTSWSPRSRASWRQGVTEVTLLGQNVNSYGRDITKRGPLFAQLLREVGAIDGLRRVRFTSPHPKDMRPETFRGHGRDAGGVQPPALPAAVGQRPHPRGHAPRLHRRSATSRRSRLAREAIADLAVTTDIIVGLPRRDRGRLRSHARSRRRRSVTTAATRSSSRPARAPRRRR